MTSKFIVYGSHYGSDELPEIVAYAATRAEAEAIIAGEPTEIMEMASFDFYLIAEEFGDSVRFTSDAMLKGGLTIRSS
jgi:hypothetical protein